MSESDKERNRDDGDREKSNASGNYDPRLDFFSEQFDPLYALSRDKSEIRVFSIKCFDNLSAYESAQKKKNVPTPAQKIEPKAGSSKDADNKVSGQRRFLPHQMPVRVERKEKKNIFTRMENMTGPLQHLKKCKDENLRIKVYTRNANGIRGYCVGYVTAFDKHWNLALRDITEVWTRKKKRKTTTTTLDENQSYKAKRIVQPPAIKILKETSKEEVCSRKVDQFIMRGEHVVLISVLQTSKT